MDENYYRKAIDAVNRNEKGMWGEYDADSNEGFEDFSRLWNILNDEEATISAKTYFEAINLCIYSFFGSIQNPVPVWSDVLRHYETALKNNDEAFVEELRKYLTDSYDSISDVSNFYRFIHLAIESDDLDMTKLIFNHTPVEAECWDLLGEMYAEHPQMAAYYEIFGDLTYDWLPEGDPEFRRAIELMYIHFGSMPDMEKLRDYHYRYCE